MKKSMIVCAAGGIVTREEDDHILLIHRIKYNDWSLPKGKLEKGESWEEAAIREVREETGFDASIQGVAGCTDYPLARNRYKLVVYFAMKTRGAQGKQSRLDNKEVTVKWIRLTEAQKRLTYDNQKLLLKKYAAR